jgi:hypothetical protein
MLKFKYKNLYRRVRTSFSAIPLVGEGESHGYTTASP